MRHVWCGKDFNFITGKDVDETLMDRCRNENYVKKENYIIPKI